MSFANLYTHRLVADTNAKPCLICFRPATSVLITQDQADFFYVCLGHLKDRSFATPVVDTAAENAAREKRLKEEVERVKAEFAEREKRRKEREKAKKKDDKGKDEKDEKEKDEKEKKKKDDDDKDDEEKKKEGEEEGKKEPEGPPPKQFNLHRKFYDMRVQRAKLAAQAKKNADLLRSPSAFPSVPRGGPV